MKQRGFQIKYNYEASRELVRQVPDLMDTPNPESDRKKGFCEGKTGAFVPPSVSAGETED